MYDEFKMCYFHVLVRFPFSNSINLKSRCFVIPYQTSTNIQLLIEDLDTAVIGSVFKVKNDIVCQDITLSAESLNPQALADSRQKKLVSSLL